MDDSQTPSEDSRAVTGRSKREQILGPQHVAKNTPQPAEFAHEWAQLALRVAWGEVWPRGVIDDRTRCMITVAMLAALGCEDELAVHLRGARNVGVSDEELREVLIHLSIYVGFARARAAFKVASEALSSDRRGIRLGRAETNFIGSRIWPLASDLSDDIYAFGAGISRWAGVIVNSLVGKVLLITGASRGMGAATARAAARAGALVACAARDQKALMRLVEDIRSEGFQALAVPTDIADGDAVQRMVRTTLERLGRLDFAFNNAGTHRPGFVHELAEDDWDAVMNVNLRGLFLCMKHEISAMRDCGRGGVIVNTASVGAHRGVWESPVYSASKHGIIGLSKSAALVYGDEGIRINVLSPGPIQTELLSGAAADGRIAELAAATSLKRLGQPDEIATVVLFLLSEEASFITGTTVVVDGGFLTGHA
jgi:A-factor type gamma-butyrolactone 1'-reductase (1S-forming)